jgi:hypothetical protein
MCECTYNCSCEIDTSKPEQYQIEYNGEWWDVVSLYDTGYRGKRNHLRYSVVFKVPSNLNNHSQTWASHNQLRLKPKWEPEIGKYYLLSDHADRLNTNAGFFGKYIGKKSDGRYQVEGSGFSWKYCWPVSPHVVLGD